DQLMQITSIDLYNMLKGKLGDKETKSLVCFVETQTEDIIASKKDYFLTKTDKVDLIERIERLRTETVESKAEMIKWMFIFWAGQTLVITGIILTIMNAYLK
ncbi:MAG: hypothetical protein ABI772_13595, partial [Bacteroidota bacterium]